MNNALDFTGKRILIDGSARGIGKETAIYLTKLGAKVILIDLSEEDLKAAISDLEGDDNAYVAFDLGGLEAIEPMIKEVVAKYGPIDGFVHCVGIRCRRPINLITPQVLNDVMCVNYGSFIELVRSITKRNRFNKGLSIVAISSISTKTGGSTITAYAASKAAIDASIRCLAHELAGKGIRLNSVMPGQVNTPAYAAMMEATGGKDVVMERQYLGLGEARDVANMVAFLLSDNARMITGAAIPLDGGYFTA